METKILIIGLALNLLNTNAFAGNVQLEHAKRLVSEYNCKEAVEVLAPVLVDEKISDDAVSISLDCLYKMKEFKKAVELARNYTKNRKAFVDARVKLIESLIAQNALDKAIEESSKLSVDFPHYEFVNLLHAKTLREKSISAAAEFLKKFVDEHPQFGEARSELADVYLSLGKVPQALDQMKEVAKTGPITHDLYLAMGRAHASLGNVPTAFENFQFAQRLQPKMAITYLEQSRLKGKVGDLRAAYDIVANALDTVKPSEREPLHFETVRLKLKTGHFEQARTLLKSIESRPDNSDVIQYLLVKSYILEKDYTTAEDILERYAKSNPNKPWIATARANIQNQNSDKSTEPTMVVKQEPQAVPQVQSQPTPQVQPQKEPTRAPASEHKYELIRNGDTLYQISRRLYGKAQYWKDIFELNKDTLSNPDALKAGRYLKVCEGPCPQ